MNRKPTLLNLEIEIVQKVKDKIVRPCSMSDVINDLMQYALDSGYVIDAFVKARNDEMTIRAESNITHEN